MWAQNALPCCTRHTAQVARGRISRGRFAPSLATSSCARPSVMCRKPSGSRMGCGVCQKASTSTLMAVSAAFAPSECPPMPSMTTSNAECSDTATDTRSWLSLRQPRRLTSAYSMRKAVLTALINCRAVYFTPRNESRELRPMIASMTGFARRELGGIWGTLTCELRSVNHRYLEPGFRLPEELRPLESELRQLLAKHLKRGKVDCTVHLRAAQAAERELRIDAVALERVA